MRRAEIGICAAAAAAACILTGCSMLDQVVGADDWKSWKPAATTLQVYQDGSLTETILDTLNQSYYDADELQDMVARSVRLYNEDAGEAALNVTEYTVEQQNLKLVIQYASGEDYRSYNVNADDAACAVAAAEKAEKLVFLSDIEGVCRDPLDPTTLISQLTVNEAERFILEGNAGGGMLPKLKNCIEAIECGTRRVHILDGRIHHCMLLEIFTDRGFGTMFYH